MSERAAEPLEDLMIAMDVVDTLRHRQGLVERELDAEGRRDRLIARLREIYTAQGIEVTDAVLEEGVRALEEDRFRYDPPTESFAIRLAKLYVHRGRWGKPLLLALLLGLAGWTAYFFLVTQPRDERTAALPLRLETAYAEIDRAARSDQARERAQALQAQARLALSDGDLDRASSEIARLERLHRQLVQTYEVRIVSRPNENSGIWRVPDANPDARNYYLIVEAVDGKGQILRLPIASEENRAVREVRRWGVRVDEETFEAVAADKRDDGIIQNYIIGRKVAGELEPDYVIATTGATITEW